MLKFQSFSVGSVWTSSVVLILLDNPADSRPFASSINDLFPEKADPGQLRALNSLIRTVYQCLFSRKHTYGSEPFAPPSENLTSTGSMSSLRNHVTNIAQDYIAQFPSPDHYGGNAAIHSVAKRCIKGEIDDRDILTWLLQCLEFRHGLSQLADIYVDFACPARKMASCAEWDSESLLDGHDGSKITQKEYVELIRIIYRSGLFPRPIEEQGMDWTKGDDYLAVELLASGLAEDELQQKLDELLACECR